MSALFQVTGFSAQIWDIGGNKGAQEMDSGLLSIPLRVCMFVFYMVSRLIAGGKIYLLQLSGSGHLARTKF